MKSDETQAKKYSEYYTSKCEQWRSGPRVDRKSTNSLCCVAFILLFLVFLGIGVYQGKRLREAEDSSETSKLSDIDGTEHQLPMLVGVVSSLVFAFFYIMLIRYFPKATVYALLVLTGLGGIGLVIMALMLKSIGMSVALLLVLLGYLGLIYRMKFNLERSLALIRPTLQFMNERRRVFFSPLLQLFLCVLLIFFWAIIFIVISLRLKHAEAFNVASKQLWMGLWVAYLLFFILIFYYMTAFTVATICAHWSFGFPDDFGLCTSYRRLCGSNCGSIVAGAFYFLLLLPINLILGIAKLGGENNGLLNACKSPLNYCFEDADRFLAVANNYSIVMVAITGEPFLESCKMTMGLLNEQIQMVNVNGLITRLITLGGSVGSACIGTLFSQAFLGNFAAKELTREQLLAIVFASGLAFSAIVISVLAESITAIFILSVMQERYKSMGLQSQNMLSYVKSALDKDTACYELAPTTQK